MSSAADTNITTIDSKKPTTKQELIAANIKLLIEQLEAGHSEALTNYLTAMSRFHNYSFGNVLEIARQMPTATRVAGFWTWKNLGRSVKAGSKGIRILAPIVGVRRKKQKEAERDITKQNERVLLGFRNAYVFDISQTEGVDLPSLHEVNGDPGENIDRLAAFLKSKGIQLVYNEKIAPALGMSYGGRIALLPGLSKAEEFSALAHETAHELLHKAERRTATTKTVRETEAEGRCLCRRQGRWTRYEKRIGGLYQPLPRERFAAGREFGSHPADLRCHSRGTGAAPSRPNCN